MILEFFIIKLMIAKLNELKVHTRIFLDDEESNYFVVLKTLESVLAKKAECDKMKKEVEIGLIDIGSLLPVDHQLRPLIHKPTRFKELTKNELRVYLDDP